MEKLVKNAQMQFEKNNKVRITIYPNRSVNDCYDMVFNNLGEAIDCISYYYGSVNDDIYVAAQ